MEDSAAEFGANIPLTDPAPMTVDQLQASVKLPTRPHARLDART